MSELYDKEQKHFRMMSRRKNEVKKRNYETINPGNGKKLRGRYRHNDNDNESSQTTQALDIDPCTYMVLCSSVCVGCSTKILISWLMRTRADEAARIFRLRILYLKYVINLLLEM